MKRRMEANRGKYLTAVGDPKSDFKPAQLQWIGAVSMNYNEAEAAIDRALFQATWLPSALRLEVSTRINGIEGKIEIIKAAAKHHDLSDAVCRDIQASLGKGGFMLMKGYRDAVIHARAFNVPKGVGIRIDRRAETYEVLLTVTALKTLYDHITAVRKELKRIEYLMSYAATRPKVSPKQAEEIDREIGREARGLHQHLVEREKLPKLPEFPSDASLKRVADARMRAMMAELDKLVEAARADLTQRYGLTS